jgi:hypothetical protein
MVKRPISESSPYNIWIKFKNRWGYLKITIVISQEIDPAAGFIETFLLLFQNFYFRQ